MFFQTRYLVWRLCHFVGHDRLHRTAESVGPLLPTVHDEVFEEVMLWHGGGKTDRQTDRQTDGVAV